MPEMLTPDIPYHRFKADVYQLGNAILNVIAVRFLLLCGINSE